MGTLQAVPSYDVNLAVVLHRLFLLYCGKGCLTALNHAFRAFWHPSIHLHATTTESLEVAYADCSSCQKAHRGRSTAVGPRTPRWPPRRPAAA